MLSVATVAVFLGLGLVDGTIILEPALAILILAPEFFSLSGKSAMTIMLR